MLDEAIAKTLAQKSKDWDPPEHERFWLTHHRTGDQGWLCRRHGTLHVKLNRPDDTALIFRKHEWLPDRAHRPFTRQQIVKAAFEFDRELCLSIGERQLASRKWSKLTDKQRQAWMDKGPTRPKLRARMFKLITEELEQVVRVS